MSAGEIESLELGDQELCLLYIVLVLVLGVSGGAAWLSVGCRLRHTRRGQGGHCSWHRGNDQISGVSIKRINC